MTVTALLDTSVLYGPYLGDVVLAFAERSLFRPLWSLDILDELEINLLEQGESPRLVERRIRTLRQYFPDALVTGHEGIAERMACPPGGRRVLAAAVVGNAHALVTFAVDDFPAESAAAYDLAVVHPDAFLLRQLESRPGTATEVLRQLASDYAAGGFEVGELFVRLAGAGVPGFARAANGRLGELAAG